MKTLGLISLALVMDLSAARSCKNISVLVSLTARNSIFSVQPAQNNIEVTNFVLNNVQQGHTTTDLWKGYANISGNYNISVTYCTPDNGPGDAIQLLTHGVGLDRSYWDLPFNDYNYSYVEQALAAGYSTLSYDRLGVGDSARADPIQAIQSPLEISALVALTKLLKDGGITGVSDSYDKIIHVGHSFGAALSYALTKEYPDLSDGLILQGFSQNGTFSPYILFGGNFIAVQNTPLASSYPEGYFAIGNPSAMHASFFSPGQFDAAILDLIYSTSQAVSQGEFLTSAGVASGTNHFSGPVLIITGRRDVPFCGGDCFITGNSSVPNIPTFSKNNFPNASAFEVVIVPEAGHVLNLEYSHPYTYQQMLAFLKANEKQSSRPRD